MSLAPAVPRVLLPMLILLAMAAPATASPAAADSAQTQDAAIYQLRIYRIFDASRDAFHARFRDHAMRIMRRYGFDIVAMWEARGEDGPEFVYLLRWPDEATMTAQWEKFMADEEWTQIKRVTAAEHGDFVGGIEERTLRLADYSPAGFAK